MTRLWSTLGLLVLVTMLFLVSGCSRDSIFGTSDNAADNSELVSLIQFVSAGDTVQYAARVETMDQNRRMLTFAGKSDTVIAAQNCEIVRLNNDNLECPIPFSDILPGDSLQINAVQQQNKYILAHRIRNCSKLGNYDLAFRDTIIAIDYDAGTIRTANRLETIIIDSATIIWATNPNGPNADSGNSLQNTGSASAAKQIKYSLENQVRLSNDTILTIASLVVGNVVEIKARIVDPSTLLAVSIKLANCSISECTRFTANLTSVDTDARIVTFEGLSWLGMVCKGTKLIGLDGEVLTLADFNAGELVAVKGFPLTGDSLKVCEMEKVVE